MLKFWFNVAAMSAEAQQVMWLRSMKIAGGARGADREATRMVSEKISAAQEAGFQLMLGKSAETIVGGYRKKVRANLRRLSK